MAPTATDYGGVQNKTAATTAVFTTTSVIPAYTLLVIGICADNTSATAPTITSITAVGGGTWTNRAGAVTQSGASATALTGVFVYCQTLFTTSSVSSGTSITVTFNTSPTAKAVNLWGFSEMTNTLRNTVASAGSTSGAPSIATTGTALVAGDLVIGVAGAENNIAMTGDTDTTNGSWSTNDALFSTGGNAQTNCSINMQYKLVTATGAQTYNPTNGAADSVAIVFAFVPAPTALELDTVDVTDTVTTSLTQKISALTDTFDTTIDTGKWFTFGANTPVVSSGRLQIPIAGADWQGVRSQGGDKYDLTESVLIGRCWPQPVGLSGRETNFRLQTPGGVNWIGFVIAGGNPWLLMALREDSVDDSTVDYSDITLHAWLRIRLSGTTAYWDTSPNGVNWTNMRTRTVTPSKFTNLELELSAGQGSDLGSSVVYFDNINVPPVYPKISTLTDTFDTEIDPTKWTDLYGTPTWEAGRVKTLASYNYYSGIGTSHVYDATNSSIFARLYPAPGVNSRETTIGLEIPGSQDGASIIIFGGPDTRGICLRRREGDTNYNSFPAGGYDPSKHAYLRIRMVGTTQFKYDYSPDGVTWTDFGVTETTALDMSGCKVYLGSGQWDTEPGSGYSFFDNVNTAVPNPKIETFSDSFDTEIDLYKWTVDDGAASSPVIWENGQVKMYTGSPGYSYLCSLQAYDLQESSIFCKMTPPATGRESREFNLRLGDNSQVNRAYFVITGIDGARTLGALILINSVRTDDWHPYDPVAHKWLKISLSGTTMTWHVSPDGLTWNTWLTRTVDPTFYAATTVYIESGQWQGEIDNGFGYVDYLNVPPPGSALTASLSDTISSTEFVTKILDRNVADTVNLTEVETELLDKLLADTVGTTDTLTELLDKRLDDSVDLTESLTEALNKILADTTGLTESFTAPIIPTYTGRPKYWDGNTHIQKPAKWWNGSAWIEKPWKTWTGSDWKTAK